MRNEVREVGTILKRPEGHVLVTPARTLQISSNDVDFDDWEGQRVVIAAERINGDAAVVSDIYPMMSERELRECTSFVLSRHGARAREHALARFESALARDDAGNIEIWRSIRRRIDRALAREPWPRK